MKDKEELKPFNAVIQVCPYCGKVDVYLNDGHECCRERQQVIEEKKGDE